MENSEKIKYFVTNTGFEKDTAWNIIDKFKEKIFKRTTLRKHVFDSIVILPFNHLISEYERRVRCSKIGFYRTLAKDDLSALMTYVLKHGSYINYWIDNYSELSKDMDAAYRNRDEVALKRIIFGNLNCGDVEFFFDEAVLGTRSDGFNIKAVCDKDRGGITFEKLEGPIQDKRIYDTISLKLGMVGIDMSDLVMYDSGRYCCYLGAGDRQLMCSCTGVFAEYGSCLEINQSFKTTTLNVNNIFGSNIRARYLLQSGIADFRKSKLDVDTALFVWILDVYGSTIRVKNASNFMIEKLQLSEIEIDNAFNLRFIHKIMDSTVIINCDITEETIAVSADFEECANTKFILTKDVNDKVLIRMIDSLKRRNSAGIHFKIEVNNRVYTELEQKLSDDYMKYLVNSGRH